MMHLASLGPGSRRKRWMHKTGNGSWPISGAETMAGHFQNNKWAWQAGMYLCSDLDQASVEDLICVSRFWCCKMSLGGLASLQAQSSCVRERTRRTWDISQTCHCKTFTNHLNYGPHYSEPASVQERYLSSREEERKVKAQIPANSFHWFFFPFGFQEGIKASEELGISSQVIRGPCAQRSSEPTRTGKTQTSYIRYPLLEWGYRVKKAKARRGNRGREWL